MQSIITGQTALVSASVAGSSTRVASLTGAAPAAIDWDNEPTNPMIDVSALQERTIVDDGPIPAHVGLELLEYGIPAADIDRLSAWMEGKRLRLGFMTKGIEYLIQMRREERMDEEVTQVMPAAARRRP
jgi:hypothetical protein